MIELMIEKNRMRGEAQFVGCIGQAQDRPDPEMLPAGKERFSGGTCPRCGGGPRRR